MPYVYQGKTSETLKLTSFTEFQEVPTSKETYAEYKKPSYLEKAVKLINNSDIILDLSDFKIYSQVSLINKESETSESYYVQSYDWISFKANRAEIDWGDGETEVVGETIINPSSQLALDDYQWEKVKHSFNLSKKYVIDSDNEYVKSYPSITVTLYNVTGDSKTCVIPFIPTYQSILNIGGELDVISANLTNNGTVSYVLKHKTSDTAMIMSSINWKNTGTTTETLVFEDNSDTSTTTVAYDQSGDSEDVWYWG